MPNQSFPFAIRMIGFSEQETREVDAILASARGKGYRYTCLEEDNLQDPDLYIANADQLKALARLVDLRPGDIRPALLVGTPGVDLPYPRVTRPIQPHLLIETLDKLIEKRADALSRLEASDVVVVPERRRRDRLDLDLTDPAEYIKIRGKVPSNGMVLVVDRNPALRDHLAELLRRSNVPVAWAGNESKAVELCLQRPTALVMINTSAPGVDPYSLCRSIKQQHPQVRIAVIFLVSRPFEYDLQLARHVGADGFLNKPLAPHHLMSVMKKFLPQAR